MVNDKEQGNKFGKTLVLEVYMYGITLVCQKLGSKDSSAWLYWSLCRKSHSNNLESSSYAALASPQINRRVPVWLETGCLRMQRGLKGSSCVGEGAASCGPSPNGTPHPFPISSSSAPPWLFTPAWCKPALRASWSAWDPVPERKRRRRW